MNPAPLLLLALTLGSCNREPLPLVGDDLGTVRDFAEAPLDLRFAACHQALLIANTSIQGTTPVGQFLGQYSWAFYTAGDCAERAHLVAYGENLLLSTQDNALVVDFPNPTVLGPQPVKVHYYLGGKQFDADGTATLTFATPLFPRGDSERKLEGDLAVTGSDLDLHGHFDAWHCPMLDLFCI